MIWFRLKGCLLKYKIAHLEALLLRSIGILIASVLSAVLVASVHLLPIGD